MRRPRMRRLRTRIIRNLWSLYFILSRRWSYWVLMKAFFSLFIRFTVIVRKLRVILRAIRHIWSAMSRLRLMLKGTRFRLRAIRFRLKVMRFRLRAMSSLRVMLRVVNMRVSLISFHTKGALALCVFMFNRRLITIQKFYLFIIILFL